MNKFNKIILTTFIFLLVFVTGCKKNTTNNTENNNENTNNNGNNTENTIVVESISVSSKSQLNFDQGEFDLSKLYINVSYSDKTVKEIQVSKEMVKTNIDNINNELQKEVIVEYKGKTCSFNITLNKLIVVEKIELLDISTLEFDQGEFDPSLIMFDAYYANGNIEFVELNLDMIISGKDELNEVGTHIVTVKYEDITFDINIVIKEVVEKVVNETRREHGKE